MKLREGFVIIFLIAFTLHASAQKVRKIELLNANSLEYDEDLGTKARRLIGDVVFKHEEALLYCDSAYLYENNALDAFGNVHITQGDSLHLYGQTLKYNGNTKRAEIKGNVKLIDKDISLTTEALNYDMQQNIGNYLTPGKIINKENTLTSNIGLYNSNTKEFNFKKNVVLVNPQYIMNSDTLKYNTVTKTAFFYGPTTITSKENVIYCENGWYNTDKDISQFNRNAYLKTKDQFLKGDSLFYDRNNGYGKAIRNVHIIDTTQNLHIKGRLAEHYENTGNSIVTGDVLFMQRYNNDTLFMHADTIRSTYTNSPKQIEKPSQVAKADKKRQKLTNDIKKPDKPVIVKDTTRFVFEDSKRILMAYHGVKFFKSDMQGKCDSLTYTYGDSTMRLFKSPVIWSDENQITGDLIELVTADGKINGLKINSNSFIISKEDSVNYNQVKGKKLTGSFTDNVLRRVDIKGNGETVYYAKDKTEIIGVNKAACSDILIIFTKNEVEKITFIKKPEATFYPIGQADSAELILKDFKWRAPERPLSKEDIFK